MLDVLRSLVAFAPRQVLMVVVMTLALSVTSGVSLLMLVPLLDVAGLDVGQGTIGVLAEVVAGAFDLLGVALSIPLVLGVYLLVVTLEALLGRVQSVRTTLLYSTYVMHLRQRLYGAITRSTWAFYARHKSTTFVHALTQELERVGGATSALVSLIAKLVLTGIYLALALYLSPATSLLVLACGSVLMALLARPTGAGKAKGEAVSIAYQEMFGAIGEHLAGMRVSKGHGTEALHVDRFSLRTRRAADSVIDVARNQADVGFWLKTGSAAILAAIFYVALVVLALPLASILLLLYLFARLVPMVTGVQRHVHQMLNLLPAVDRVDDMLARFDARAEAPAGSAPAPTLQREIRFEGVSFAYDGEGDEAGATTLEDVDLVLRAGATTAIVGPSGAGKSTVADLVVGLLTPRGGTVWVDEVALEGAAVHAWRRRIGYVNQDTFLFNDTVRENLLAVRPEATEAEVHEALAAAAAGFVLHLPEGLDTLMGERGVRLSGGERQRIALARALLRRPALLVLDEATSALDAENERAIQEAIERMAGRQTILLIAHRLSSVRAADMIHVMEAGRVVESGSWDELMRREGGRFRALCIAQGVVREAPLETGVER